MVYISVSCFVLLVVLKLLHFIGVIVRYKLLSVKVIMGTVVLRICVIVQFKLNSAKVNNELLKWKKEVCVSTSWMGTNVNAGIDSDVLL